MDELELALAAAGAAGKLMMEHYRRGVAAQIKPDGSPVTVADKECEKMIITAIRQEFPDALFLSEETHPDEPAAPERWVIDPIDGTRNFVGRTPRFGSIIGLEKRGLIVLGVMTCPPSGLTVWAQAGKGAYANGRRIHVSKVSELCKARLALQDGRFLGTAESKAITRKLAGLGPKPSNPGGGISPLDHYELACGATDLLVTSGKPWDVSAPKIIVEEAGGRFTDLQGNATIYSGGPYISANPSLHRKALRLLSVK